MMTTIVVPFDPGSPRQEVAADKAVLVGDQVDQRASEVRDSTTEPGRQVPPFSLLTEQAAAVLAQYVKAWSRLQQA